MSTITAPFYGCIAYEKLHDPLVITIHDAAGQRHQAAAWMTDRGGCGKTTHHQRALIIDGGSANLRNPDPGEVINIRFDYVKQFASQMYLGKPCGGAQVDVVNTVTNEMAALYIFTGQDCGKPPKPIVVKPPTVRPAVQEEIPPPKLAEDDPTPLPAVVPEPSSMLLLGSALVLRMLWQKL
jgi:hypothetical protein